MKPTNEQIKEFWEWCGIRYEADQDEFKVIFPDEQPWYNFGSDWKMGEIEPPIDLNNLFTYAVPKLLDDGWQVTLVSIGNIPRFGTMLWQARIDKKDNFHAQRDKDPALALFWALDEARKK